MAVTIDYTTRTISIPKADMTLVQSAPAEIYELDIDAFRSELKDIEDNIGGISFVDTHFSSTAVTADGGVVARVFEIINGYTVTFEDGSYTVNIVGASTNIAEVTNLNHVKVSGVSSTFLAQHSVSKQAPSSE
jgi:hypothetical protein